MIRWFAAAVAMAGMFISAAAQEKTDEVALRVVKYEGLKEEIQKHRGKVVMVDLWADFCKPCKDAFPHTVELHRKFQDKGLVVVSVALDPLDEDAAATKGRVLKFLQKQKATFPNLLLDETDVFWTKKFRIDGPPSIYVFSRQGKWTQFTAQELEDHPKNVDNLIEELLNEK